ncbi:hypothetical protein TVAG_272300 [Trichomonas vaginalis G3]|uniref:UDENN domain-containing protein n=1 Tax=Trichomonas vaginalis (strain ATCC PRA-98 / G3) TaxID=412133 RepID=A2FDU6_TRIV3|nr:UDENN domain-containing protein family [Trichomonas vaginalis G3]EAX96902.1 hypothetical protein TVAG_272300 [Trichomonas vaginalis G3]KAI5511089.1 UDENN domain-containing protein family [Trichomonas vaginalis G3]|eukprot:XP_001309832.1 hypothetical protein [Trichomonas vaginalis G3]
MLKGSISNQLLNFTAEDGDKWESWHAYAPLFEEFMILGPEDLAVNPHPKVLYHFPEDSQTEHNALAKFLFVDGENFRNIDISTDHLADIELSSDYPEREQIVITRGEAGRTTYIYCIRFRGSAFSRPAVNNENLLDDAHFYRSIKVMPSCMFAFCIVSYHPFHSLLFHILNLLLDIETKYRISSYNLNSAAHLSYYRKSGKGADIVFWPESTIEFRKECLETFYQASLPMYGETICLCMSGSRPIFWRMPKREDIDIQFACWGISTLLDWISLDDLITLLSFLLLENYFAVVGTNIEAISKITTVLPQLILPFFWTSPVISILPKDLLALLDSPVPTILGIYSKFRKLIPSHYVIIDIDKKHISYPNEPMLKLPKHKFLRNMLAPIYEAGQMNVGIAQNILRIISEFIIDTIVKQVISALITKVNEKNTEGTMYLPDLFYSVFDKEDLPFLKKMNETQYFVAAREQLCRMKTSINSNNQSFSSLMQPEEGPITAFQI